MTGASGPAGDSPGPGADSSGPRPGTGSPEAAAGEDRDPDTAAGRRAGEDRDPDTAAGGRGEDAGAEPDARFTFANERTFLAWSRTALALVVAGLGIVQLLPPFPGVPWGRHLIGVPLIALGAVVAAAGYGEWVMNQRSLHRGTPIPRSVLPVILTVTITAIAIISAIVLLLSAIR